MTSKVRKQIYIDATQEKELKRIAATTGESEASIIRRAIDAITLDRVASAEPQGRIRRPLGSAASWRRALDRMRSSTLVPRSGVKLFDRASLHER